MSYEAKGLLCQLLSYPDDWKVRKSTFENETCGKTKLNRIFTELKQHGYLSKQHVRDEQGRLIDTDWLISESPPPTVGFTERQETRPSVNVPLQSTNKTLSTNIKQRKENIIKEKKIIDNQIEEIIALYPERDEPINKRSAARAIRARLREKVPFEKIKQGTIGYHDYCIRTKRINTPYVKSPHKFFSPDKHFLDNWTEKGYEQTNTRKTHFDKAREYSREFLKNNG
jgi:hypothetical protein